VLSIEYTSLGLFCVPSRPGWTDTDGALRAEITGPAVPIGLCQNKTTLVNSPQVKKRNKVIY